MNSKDVGNISEAYVIAKFIEKGWTVLLPFGDNELYDVVIDRHDGKGFKKVQIKTGSVDNSIILAFTRRQHNTRTKAVVFRYTVEDVDFFAVHCLLLNKVYFVSSIDMIVPKTGKIKGALYLRLEPPKNNQLSKVMMAETYELK